MARRKLGAEEARLWESFARGIRPLQAARRPGGVVETAQALADTTAARPQKGGRSGRMPAVPVSDQEARVAAPRARPAVSVLRSIGAGVPIGIRQPGLDDTSWRALSSGKMRPQRRLDLHGLFAQDAFWQLHAFLHRSSAQGLRCVEVITGLGSGREGGIIRRELPHWLGRLDLKPLILAVVHTHARNQGAVRILLRARQRG